MMDNSPDTTDDEVGRELTVAELKPHQVVVIAPPGRKFLITMWIRFINATNVVFYSDVIKLHVVNYIRNGQIVDDRGRVVRVFEYLGEV